jgi:WD40 repeat protein
MYRLVMACIVLALITQGAGADGQTTSSGMDCVQETDYLITPDIVQDNEVFHLVVIGDSIAWGAGLEKDKKYSFLVAEWLSKQLKRPVDVKILAHTGATIEKIDDPVVQLMEQADSIFNPEQIEKTDDPVVKPPDLSSSSPTLMEQVDSIFDPEHVDLILVSGGINDVTVNNIIKLDHLVEPSESTLYYWTPVGRGAWDSGMSRLSTFSEADLRQKTKEIKPLMRDLLNKLITKCPNAAIVVTGYYPIISVKSTGLTETIRTLMPNSQFFSDYQNLDNPIEKSQLVEKSEAFSHESTESLTAAVQETSSKLVAFAGIEFKPENCYGAGDSFLWRIESGQTKTDDPLYECRVALVGDRNGDEDRTDKVAAVGHPNEKGARQYFSAIKEAIEKTSPEFLPKVEDFKGASLSTLALGESVEIDYVVSDNGELGLKQVELWRTQVKDKWPERPENPTQIMVLAGENDPHPGSFTDSPPAPGKYWYGIHVVDNAGNWNDERNSNTNGQPSSFEPVEVEIKNSQESIQPLVLNPSTPRVLYVLKHRDYVPSIAFSPDSSKVATTSWDSSSIIWDAATGNELLKFNQNEKCNHIAFSTDGSKVVTTSTTDYLDGIFIRIWDVTTGAELQMLNLNPPFTVSLGPDICKVAKAIQGFDYNYNVVQIQDMTTGAELQKLNTEYGVKLLGFSPDGSRLATGSETIIQIWDIATGDELQKLNGLFQSNLVFSPDGSKIATSYYATVQIWDVATGAKLQDLNLKSYINDVDFSPDGSMIATASVGGVRIWNVATGAELQRLNTNYNNAVDFVAFSPDSSKIATVTYMEVQIWDVATENM